MKLPQELLDKILESANMHIKVYKKINERLYWKKILVSLKAAVRYNKIDKVKYFLENTKITHREHGHAALIACKHRFLDILELLIKNALSKNIDFRHCIWHACTKGDIKSVKLMKNLGLNVKEYWMSSFKSESLKMIEFFVNQGVDISQDNYRALNACIQTGNYKVITYLMNLIPTFDKSMISNSSLSKCVVKAGLKTLRFLKEKGVSFDRVSREAINDIKLKMETEKTKFLLRNGCRADVYDTYNLYVRTNDLELIDLLMIHENDKANLIDSAVKEENKIVVNYLIDKVVDVNYIARVALSHEKFTLAGEIEANVKKTN